MTGFYQSDLLKNLPHAFFVKDFFCRKSNYSFSKNNYKQRTDTFLEQHDSSIAKALEIKPERLITLSQTHSNKVIAVDKNSTRLKQQGDSMVTKTPGIGLGILTADCAPIFFFDPKSTIIAAAHAGWKGALLGITDNTVKAMEKIGAERQNIIACIGPCISQKNYEVGQEFKDKFMLETEKNSVFFVKKKNGKFLFDLSNYLVRKLNRMGVVKTSCLNICTYSNEKELYSYRRSQHKKEDSTLRNISAITLKT